MATLHAAQTPSSLSTSSFGRLRLAITSYGTGRPIENASIQIANTGQPDQVIEEVTTDVTGQTTSLELSAPPVEYSLEPSANQPYSEYNFLIQAPGYEALEINSAEILAGETAIQNAALIPTVEEDSAELYVIPPHTLFYEYPPKIAEDEIKPLNEPGEVVLSRVVIPEFVVVHDGPPNDSSAQDYYVRYRDYIKNVASSEIYATWPESTIQANVLAIMSFTLNRVYTEWYRNKGFDFTITTSTAYDHKWIPNRNIFESISNVVDEIFSNYLARPNVSQPILTQYCDGKRVSCPNWLSQWGSKSLGDQGYSAIEIIHNYYGDSMYIGTAEAISGVPSSWPGYLLEQGSSGDKIRQIQSQLNVISDAYPLIPKIAVDGIYGPRTAEAVSTFQRVFNLPQTGTVDFTTWYKISEIYVAVSRIAELYP